MVADSSRARARSMMEPEILGLNGQAPMTPVGTNGPQQQRSKELARPLAFAKGGQVNKMLADAKQDKGMVKSGVKQHESALHKGRPKTKLKLADGGKVDRDSIEFTGPEMDEIEAKDGARDPKSGYSKEMKASQSGSRALYNQLMKGKSMRTQLDAAAAYDDYMRGRDKYAKGGHVKPKAAKGPKTMTAKPPRIGKAPADMGMTGANGMAAPNDDPTGGGPMFRKGGKVMKKAAGGAAKVRRGIASESGQIKQVVPRSKMGR